jgi:hypothetical protein
MPTSILRKQWPCFCSLQEMLDCPDLLDPWEYVDMIREMVKKDVWSSDYMHPWTQYYARKNKTDEKVRTIKSEMKRVLQLYTLYEDAIQDIKDPVEEIRYTVSFLDMAWTLTHMPQTLQDNMKQLFLEGDDISMDMYISGLFFYPYLMILVSL